MAESRFPGGIVRGPERLRTTGATGVRANIDVRTGEEAIGQAIAGFGEAGFDLGLRIRQKRQEMTDANSSVQADDLRRLADEEFEAFKLINPQDTWEKERLRQTGEVAENISKLPFSPSALSQQQIKSENYTNISTATALTDATRQLREETIVLQTNALTAAFRSGDPVKIAEQSRIFADNGSNMGMSKGIVLANIKAAREAGEKLRKQDTLDKWQDDIAENPTATKQILNNELNLRAKDKGVISEEELSSENIQSLINSSINRESQLLADTEQQLNAKNSALETKLHDDIVDGRASITDIAKSSLPAEAKRRLERDIADVAKRDIARTWAIQDSSSARTEKDALLVSLEAGVIDINEARSSLSKLARRKTPDNRSVLTKATFDKTMEQFRKGGRGAIDIFTGEQTAKVENSLTFRLTERDARLRIRSEARTLTPTEKRQFSTTGFLLQVANHQLTLYNEGLAQRLRILGIEDTSGKEAKAEAVKVWESIKRKDLSQQINDFLSFSGQQLVRPIGITIEMWENVDNRAAIVRGVSMGLNNEQISELLFR